MLKLMQGDCRDLLPTLEAASIDAIVTDPPYGTASGSKVQRRGGVLETFDIAWDKDLPLFWLPDAARVLKPGGSLLVFTDKKAVSVVWDALRSAGLTPLHTVYWHKTNPPPQPRQNFCSAVETIIFARKPGKVLYWGGGGATANIFSAPLVGGLERTKHPTQKPVPLCRWLVGLSCPVGGTVLDPFMGSGSVGVGAIMSGRDFVGMEIDPEYSIYAAGRLASTPAPLSLPVYRAGELFQEAQ